MKNKKIKVVVAMSGGVDSAVSAFLLKQKGYEIIGMFMKLGFNQVESEATARKICQKLKIKFYPINLASQFKKDVINYFLDSYAKGITPNPCIKCNQVIKFGSLLKYAKKTRADYLATGHYVKNAKCKMQNAKFIYKLYRGKDENKDQSYFLYTLTQNQLEQILFPLGEYTKEEVKKIADDEKLPYIKKESQDVCFLTSDTFSKAQAGHNDFLIKNLKLKPGKIKTLDNKMIGQHQGLPLYTIGQRKGVDIGGIGPFYVVKADHKTNTLYVTKGRDDKALYKDQLVAKNFNWVSSKAPKLPLPCEAIIRYRHKPVECKIEKLKAKSNYLIKFAVPQRAVTPGQSIVIYKNKMVLGGGIIV